VTRSIVFQVVGPCKTEASQKPIPMDDCLAEALEVWRAQSHYRADGDWVFASVKSRGRWRYWRQPIMRKIIRPVAINFGISGRLGWHTFRHTYSTLLRATGADIKVMQELLRHASAWVTLDSTLRRLPTRNEGLRRRLCGSWSAGRHERNSLRRPTVCAHLFARKDV
jgi:integrase